MDPGGAPMKLFLVFMLAVSGLLAADATGTWTGSLLGPDGQQGTAHLVLRQDGEKLTGTAGPSPEEQHEIENGKSADGKITFEVGSEGGTMKFDLKQEGDEIKGEISMERDGETRKAQLAVTRVK
jgi:hypothetical protein